MIGEWLPDNRKGKGSWVVCVMFSLVLLLPTTCPLYGQRIYRTKGDKNYVRIAGNTKIPKEMERQIKIRDGYSPNDKRVVVGFLIPPELGGAADFNNLTALPKKDAKQRKEVEKKILKQVRNGQMSIGEARSHIVYWKAYQNTPNAKVRR